MSSCKTDIFHTDPTIRRFPSLLFIFLHCPIFPLYFFCLQLMLNHNTRLKVTKADCMASSGPSFYPLALSLSHFPKLSIFVSLLTGDCVPIGQMQCTVWSFLRALSMLSVLTGLGNTESIIITCSAFRTCPLNNSYTLESSVYPQEEGGMGVLT